MNLLLCVTIGPAIPVSYRNSVAEQLKTRIPEVIIYDCDNHSEALIVRYAINLLKEAQKAAVIIQVTSVESETKEQVLGNVRILFEQLLQQADNVRVLFSGVHLMAERMLSLLPAGKVSKGLNETEQVREIELFLNS